MSILLLWPKAESRVLASVSFLFFVLLSLQAAKCDKFLHWSLGPSGSDISLSAILVSIGLTVCFFLDVF